LAVGVAANASFTAAAAGIPTTAVWLRADYHLSNADLGLTLGAMGLGVALSELPWGLATDRWGDRPVLLTGLAATALALLCMALFAVPTAGGIPNLHALWIAMGLVGVLGGSVNGSSGRAVMRWFPEGQRGLAMSIRQTAVPLGGGLGALLLPSLASNLGFGPVYGLLAGMCTASGVLAWHWLHEPPHASSAPEGRHANAPRVGIFKDRAVWRVVAAIGILCTPQAAVLSFATIFLHDYGRAALAGITATMVAIQLGAMGLRVASGRYTDKRGNREAFLRANTLVAVAAVALLAMLVAAGDAVPKPVLILDVIVAGICASSWHGVAYTELATLAGRDRAGTALGMANTAVFLTFFLTPLLIPHVLGVGSWAWVWGATAACALAAYPLFPGTRRPAILKAQATETAGTQGCLSPSDSRSR
jgi:MFS family permease